MTKGQRTIVSLLAIVAVLLGLNFIVRGSTSAKAQVATGPVQPSAIGMQAQQTMGSQGNDDDPSSDSSSSDSSSSDSSSSDSSSSDSSSSDSSSRGRDVAPRRGVS